MKKLISFELAGRLLMWLLAALLIFHLLVLIGVAPAEIVWGGQVQSSDALLGLEAFAILLTALFLGLTAMRVGKIGSATSGRWARIGMWLMAAYFLVNTLGNLASGVGVENFIFAPISLLSALLALRLAIE